MVKEEETVTTQFAQNDDESGEHPRPGGAWLVVLNGAEIGKRFALNAPEILIGRSPSACIQIEKDNVSRLHARLRCSEDGARIHDLGSTNGTFINDRRIVTEVPLVDGDLIRVGRTVLKYLYGSNVEQKYHEQLYQITTTDALTRVFNRRYLLEALDHELVRTRRYPRVFSLVLFDVDHFKGINDEYGHAAGDYVLREVAGAIARNVRRADVFGRYGGDEFGIVLPEIGPDQAYLVCEKLRRLIAADRFMFRDAAVPVTISLGVRTVRHDEQVVDVESIIADADARLYQAKRAGRNCTAR